jgi:hypothetical protein
VTYASLLPSLVLKCILRELKVKLGKSDKMATLRTVARKITQKSPNDVVVLAAVRSPVTRAFKGGFKDAFPEDILGPVTFSIYPLKILSDLER